MIDFELRRTLAALACAFSALTGVAAAQENCGEALNLEDADIRSVVDEIALRTGKKFVLDPRVAGRVTIKSGPNGGLCVDEAWELFQTALRVTGFIAAPVNGDTYKIIPIQEGARAAGPVGGGEAGDTVTEIVRLNHVDAREAAANLSQIISERGVVAPVSTGNAVIIVDYVRQCRTHAQGARPDRPRSRRSTARSRSKTRRRRKSRASSPISRRKFPRKARRPRRKSASFRSPRRTRSSSAPSRRSCRASSASSTNSTASGAGQSDLSVVALNHADAEEMAKLLKEIASSEAAAISGSRRMRRAARGRRGRAPRQHLVPQADEFSHHFRRRRTSSRPCARSSRNSTSAAHRSRSRRSSSRFTDQHGASNSASQYFLAHDRRQPRSVYRDEFQSGDSPMLSARSASSSRSEAS